MNPIKNYLKYALYTMRDLFIPSVAPPMVKEKTLCIVKVDAIGDYILFRNFIEAIATSSKYKDFEITLVGNILWKEIAEKLDSQWVDHFIWINPRKFQKDFPYRKECFRELQKVHYSVLIHPTVSRDYYVAESINAAISAKEKICAKGDLINTSTWQKRKSDRNYTEHISIPDEIHFEFNKNNHFFNALLNTSKQNDLYINKVNKSEKIDHPNPYCILFIGGSTDFKKWSIQNWTLLIEYILANFTEDIIISGGPDDKALSEQLQNAFIGNARVVNYTGKTSLYELLQLISGAEWMVSNETSAPHMATALNIPVLVIGNANHYGRFTPYPDHLDKKYQAVYPPIIMKERNEENRINNFYLGSDLNINTIEYPIVRDSLSQLLS